ncbi:hypothetical protein EVAR_30320_1 [Eumeta japonica]|uniref:Uncharacterized protein n=1 Tax=Eumeta variegata TaxID=151549 RepID=A0A4C1W899_EUMVA|nr:hypothetical protein EVAR_30320_1 [Eumeta japonica]
MLNSLRSSSLGANTPLRVYSGRILKCMRRSSYIQYVTKILSDLSASISGVAVNVTRLVASRRHRTRRTASVINEGPTTWLSMTNNGVHPKGERLELASYCYVCIETANASNGGAKRCDNEGTTPLNSIPSPAIWLHSSAAFKIKTNGAIGRSRVSAGGDSSRRPPSARGSSDLNCLICFIQFLSFYFLSFLKLNIILPHTASDRADSAVSTVAPTPTRRMKRQPRFGKRHVAIRKRHIETVLTILLLLLSCDASTPTVFLSQIKLLEPSFLAQRRLGTNNESRQVYGDSFLTGNGLTYSPSQTATGLNSFTKNRFYTSFPDGYVAFPKSRLTFNIRPLWGVGRHCAHVGAPPGSEAEWGRMMFNF